MLWASDTFQYRCAPEDWSDGISQDQWTAQNKWIPSDSACPGFLLGNTRPWGSRGWYVTRPCLRLGHCELLDMGLANFKIQTNSGKCAHIDLVSLVNVQHLKNCWINVIGNRIQHSNQSQRKPAVLLICMLNVFSVLDTWFLLTENFSNCLSVFYSWEFTPSHSKYTRQNMQQM